MADFWRIVILLDFLNDNFESQKKSFLENAKSFKKTQLWTTNENIDAMISITLFDGIGSVDSINTTENGYWVAKIHLLWGEPF